jgi:cyclic pyranopterin phosphate synthase
MTLTSQPSQLTDAFGRKIDYLRLSVTDRCDFRCTYCMAEDMVFLPRKEVLSIEELSLVAQAFVELGITKIRLTGGEPLIRNNISKLIGELSQMRGLSDICMTTNASHLADQAPALKAAGLQRINISLDSLNTERFKTLTRYGKLDKVLEGIDVALSHSFKTIKLNAVVLKNYNFDETQNLVDFALTRGLDITFIEEMPLGEITTHARDVEYVTSAEIREKLRENYELTSISDTTGGPARYWKATGYSNKVGFISPHSDNFCASCNRVRVTASGRLLLCLGNEHSVDLRAVLRSHPSDEVIDALKETIRNSMAIKPEKHEFNLAEEAQVLRFMNTTGG